MTISLEVRTRAADIGEVVRELAPRVDDVSIRLSSEKPIADGEWVRFTVHLRDGSVVFEGVGRSQGTRREGGRYGVVLSLLQFDERNEIMYERVLLAKDAEEQGEATGQIDISELKEIERQQQRPPPPLPKRSSLPPVPTQYGARPASIPAPPRAPSAPPPPRKSTTDPAPPPKPASLPPPARPMSRREEPKKGSPAARPKPVERKPEPKPEPIVEPKPERVAKPKPEVEDRAPRKKKKPMRIPIEEPQDMATFDTVISRPDDLAFRSSDELRLVVPPRLVARARALAPTLPQEVIDRRASPEEAVLQAALRLGLASLAALADVDDEG